MSVVYLATALAVVPVKLEKSREMTTVRAAVRLKIPTGLRSTFSESVLELSGDSL